LSRNGQSGAISPQDKSRLHRPHADASCSHAHRIERVEQVEQDLLELNPVGDVLQRLAGTGVPF
jgi:hypothetical protein